VITRHHVLRVVIDRSEGALVPRLAAHWAAPVTARALVDDSDESVMEAATAAARHRFDLGRAPLVHVTVLSATPTSHVIVVAMHHIAADGWSVGLFIDEL